MARNLHPKHHLCRRVGEKLCDLDRCPVTRRNFPPGVHGPKGHQKLTEYGQQLLEKQKAKTIYGLLERQFRGYFDRARSAKGDTGYLLHLELERRLDNVVYRLGMTKSRSAARQAVGHGHITVNGKRVTIPSYQIQSGDAVGIHERSVKSPLFNEYPKTVAQQQIPAWLAPEPEAYRGRVIRFPEPAELTPPFRVRSIVEFYSR
ncbi:30S ribosomal protein S4 [Candidatus Uhrbacteria bacterium]|nr:30S ribosomal protein S4 [Candidatus Uhrbacteria bacterium]